MPVCVFRVVFLNTVKVVVVIAEIVISVPVVTAIYSNYITEKLSQFSCFTVTIWAKPVSFSQLSQA